MASATRRAVEMPSRRRPLLSGCGHLLHGVVVVEDSEGGRTRALAAARVTVVVEGSVAVSATTRRDGAYSVVVGSCGRQEQALRDVQLRVRKATPCEKWNATRAVRLDMDLLGTEPSLWQHDVKVHAREMTSLCEVSVEKTSPSDDAQPETLQFNDDLKQIMSGVSVLSSMLWGFLLLWAIAKWATVQPTRRTEHIPDDDNYCFPRSRSVNIEKEKASKTKAATDDYTSWQEHLRKSVRADVEEACCSKRLKKTKEDIEPRRPLRLKRRRVVCMVDDDDVQDGKEI